MQKGQVRRGKPRGVLVLSDLLNDLRKEREELKQREAVAFTLGLAARMLWNVTKWVLVFFVIGGLSILWLLLTMAVGGKGWR